MPITPFRKKEARLRGSGPPITYREERCRMFTLKRNQPTLEEIESFKAREKLYEKQYQDRLAEYQNSRKSKRGGGRQRRNRKKRRET